MSADLITFLRARLGEDEQVAQSAGGGIGGNPWERYGYDQDDHLCIHRSRVLAEVQAKRSIIDEYEDLQSETESIIDRLMMPSVRVIYEHIIRYLALPYADHPSYDERWRP